MRTRNSVNNAFDIFGNPTKMDRHHDIHSYLIPDDERKWWRWFSIKNRGYSIFVYLYKHSKKGICRKVSFANITEELGIPKNSVIYEIEKLEKLGVIVQLWTGVATNKSIWKVMSPKEAKEFVASAYELDHY